MVAGLQHVLGEPGSDIIVTMHVVLRPPQPQKAAGAPPADVGKVVDSGGAGPLKRLRLVNPARVPS